MNIDNQIVLSILVICHNKRDMLKRCLDSILAQDMPFSHEIIISDDASVDGTWEVAKEYSNKYAEISAYQCNTDDYKPSIRFERSGWNRCNAYQYAKGKYIAHVDGDDFFAEGTDIYKKQVELLELHPNCSCCMANDYRLNDGDENTQMTLYHIRKKFKTGEILSSEEYIRKYFREHTCFVFRRISDFNPSRQYGGYFDDAVITAHYIQYGDIVCLADAGYVYVKYQKSLWSDVVEEKDRVLFVFSLSFMKLIPRWRDVVWSERFQMIDIYSVIRLSLSGHKVKEENLRWINAFDYYIYHTFNRKLKVSDYFHLVSLMLYVRFLAFTRAKSHFLFDILERYL